MLYAKKIVLYWLGGDTSSLDDLVEEFVRDGVVGQDCATVEDMIDEMVVGDGSRDYSLLTSSHPGESVEEAVRFAEALTGEFEGKVQVVVC